MLHCENRHYYRLAWTYVLLRYLGFGAARTLRKVVRFRVVTSGGIPALIYTQKNQMQQRTIVTKKKGTREKRDLSKKDRCDKTKKKAYYL